MASSTFPTLLRGKIIPVPSPLKSTPVFSPRPKAEAYSNAVDVVERLHDPTDPSTERTAPPCSAHVQHDDVPRGLDPVEDEEDFLQHDGVATVMMKLPAQGFA